MIFLNFIFRFLNLYREMDFGLVRHNLNYVHYLGMKFARFHQKDLNQQKERGDVDTIFPGGGANVKI